MKQTIRGLGLAETTVVDLGCGDFRVGQQILGPGVRYIGVDVVPELILHNNKAHGAENVRFECLDAAADDLPDGDVCLIRQVFQHLSNDEISRVLNKIGAYKVTLITEHYPNDANSCIPNLDKPHGGDVRFSDHSASYWTGRPST